MVEQNENFKTEEEQRYRVADDVVIMVSKRKVRVLVLGEDVTALCVVLNDKGELEVYDWWGYGS